MKIIPGESMICNYCGCEESEIIAEYTRFEKNNVLQCKKCGLVYLEIKKDKESVESFYSSEYRKIPTVPILTAEEHFNHEVLQNDANNRIRFITEHMKIKGRRILEIGSASGSLLQKISEFGCKEVVGIELNREFAEYARKKGFKVFTRTIEELNFREEFDAAVTFFTLEHVYDPMVVIKAIYTALKPGSYFLGEVPNQNDWRILIFNDEIVKRLHYDPNHYFYFSPVTLKNYLETCGFSDIQLETVERYNSFLQLKNIICNKEHGKNIDEILKKYIFPKNEKEDVRLPDIDKPIECEFNRVFEKGVNSELMGNCLRFIANKN